MLRAGVAVTAALMALGPSSSDAFHTSPSLSKMDAVLRGNPSFGVSPRVGASHSLSKVPRRTSVTRRPFTPVGMSLASSAAQTLTSSQAAVVDKIKASRNLEPKDYPREQGFDTFTVGDSQGTITAYEAPGKDNVAWCSALNINGPNMCLSSLTTWCGPLYEVPHLCTRTVVTDSQVDLFIDFRPRAYAAYETRLDDGSYGEPDSREWFGYKSARDGFEALFFTAEAEAWATAVKNQGTSKPKATGDDLLYRGPLAIDISLPATDESVALCAKACAEAADMWVQWCETTEPLPAGMKVTSTYAYDTKMRAQMFGVLVGIYSGLFGDQGRNLAAADAGPLDEAYVGGAS